MLGEKIGETQGKITGVRVIQGPDGQPRVETSFQGSGKVYGVETSELGSYTAQLTPAGVLQGEGQGVVMTKDGEGYSWRAHGVGRPTGKGMAAHWSASLVFQTTSQKLARLNGVLGVVEWDVDENGNAKGSLHEWK